MSHSHLRNTILLLFILIGGNQTAFATHIIGGEMNYKCLGNDQYQVSLTVYRDCYLGEAPLDDTAYVAAFNIDGALVTTLPILLGQIDTINQVDACLLIPANICVETTTYIDTITLVNRPGGYRLVYQRCCRNGTILNIVDPLNTGATYDITLTEMAMATCNSSPVLSEWPPTFVCVNRPLVFDSRATDIDGDSIAYRLCAPLRGGTSIDNPRPRPAMPPPYNTIVWNAPTYDLDNLLGGVPLKIDPITGTLTGTPNLIGQFVVGVCIDEYRNGQLLSSTRRDFQYNVIPCEDVVAKFETPKSQCDDLTIYPKNQTDGEPDGYLWKFMDSTGTQLGSSTDKNPSFTFPSTGNYTIRLIVNPNSICADSSEQSILLRPNTIIADFQYDILGCADSLRLQFTDNSTISSGTIDVWSWNFDGEIDQFISLEQHPQITLMSSQQLQATLSVSTDDGCFAQQSIELNASIIPDSFSVSEFDTLIVCKGDSIELNPIFNSDLTYSWSPIDGLSDPTSPNPKAFPEESTAYIVMIRDSASSCELRKNVFLEVIDFDNSFDFTLDTLSCGDSVRIQLNPNPSYDLNNVNLVWEIQSASIQSIFTHQTPIFDITQEEQVTITGTVSDNFGCSKTVTKTVEFDFVSTTIPSQYTFCRGDSIQLNTNFDPNLFYSWSPVELFTDPKLPNPKISPINNTTVTVSISSDISSCPIERSTNITVLNSIEIADFQFRVNGCSDSLILEITDVISQPVGFINEISWTLNGDIAQQNSTQLTPTFVLKNSQFVELSMTINPSGTCPKTATKLFRVNLLEDISLVDTLFICQGEQVALNPESKFPEYVYSWSPLNNLDNPKAINPIAQPTQTTTFQVTYTDSTELCVLSNFITVVVKDTLPPIDADINIACDGKTVEIAPNSIGLIHYDFGDNSLAVITSTDSFITHNYKSADQFLLKMSYVSDNVCSDSITKEIDLPSDNLIPKFEWNVEACSNNIADLELLDLSTSPFGKITQRDWILSNGMTSSQEDPLFLIETAEELTATLVLTLDNDETCKDSIQLTIPPLVIEEMLADTLIDCNGTSIALNPTFDENYTYLWTPKEELVDATAPNPRVQVTQPQQYQVQISNQYDCVVMDSVFTNAVPKIEISSLEIPVVCEPSEVILMAESEQTDQLVWTNENGDSLGFEPELLVNINDTKRYTATFTDAYNCQASETIIVDYQPVRLGYENDQPICQGESDRLVINNIDAENDLKFDWSPQEDIVNGGESINPEVQPEEPTLFTFVAGNSAGCKTEGEIFVDVLSLPTVMADAAPVQIFEGETSQLSATEQPDYLYDWTPSGNLDNPSISTPIASPIIETTYTVTVTDENGCKNQANTTVSIRESICDFPYIFVPSGFTPNGDGENDQLFVRGAFIDELTFIIYDRWGDKVFETSNQEIGWDGTKNGKELPPGVFGYFLNAKCKNGDTYSRQGNITLIR